MNNIGHTIYTTIVHYAEGGKRVTRVELPSHLYEDYATEPGLSRMISTLKVDVVENDKLKEPAFFAEAK